MIKGILFDKDGTLIDFFSLWLQAARASVAEFLKENGQPVTQELYDCVMKAMGVENGKVDPRGGLAYKSYKEIAQDVCGALEEKEIRISADTAGIQLEELFNANVSGKDVTFVQLADLRELMKALKSRKIRVGLATADTMHSAKNCLDALDILEQFDYLGADDGIRRPKPEADMFLEFQEKFGLQADEIAVVGDTYNDITFARKNGGVAVGVLSGVSRREDFGEEADYIVGSVRELPGLLDKIRTENNE